MRNARRPMGRFFCLLMAMAAVSLPGSVRTLTAQQTTGPAMTQVVDTVYRADGSAALGTVLISWPAFTTADGKAVAAGSLSVRLGSGGAFAASLVPNSGAQPAGVYYRVVYQLTGQEPSTEYWVVPATGSTSIGAVRAKLMPPTIAAQVLTRDVADTNYMHVAGDQTVSGVKTFSTVNAQNINGALNAAAFPGSDFGAKVNAAIAACSGNNAGQQCEVRIPQGIFSHNTTMTLTAGVVLRCSGQETTTLNYTGNGTAINFAAAGAQIRDCGLTLGTSALVGLDMAGHHGIADAVYLQGGGAATTLIRVHSDVNMLSKVRESGILGTGIQIDHATDTYLTDVNIYGVPGNTTSQTLVVDTLTGGLQVENFSGGYAGLHGLVVRNAMPDHAAGGPTWLFFRNFVADCSAGGDGWLFDSSLGSAQLGATFLDSWSAGAGKNCTNNTVVTANAAGIRISGGRGIHIGGGSKIRANEGSGIAIDNSNAGNIQIEDSFIYGNNNQNAGTAQGIDVTAYVDGLTITGNTIGNYYYEPGFQQYGVKISPNGSQNLVIASNTFSGNTVGAILNPASPAQYVQFGNTNSNGTSSPNSVLLGDVAAYEKGSSYPAPWMVAERGAAANYKFGYGLNCHWSGSGWQFDSDGANNGGACLFADGSTGHVDLYTVPTNAPASGQSFTPAQLENFKRVHFDAAGTVQFFGNLNTTGTLTAQQATFAGTTTVPTPVNPTDAANKAYVDANAGGGSGNLASPSAIGTVAPNAGTFTILDNVPNAAAFPGSDTCAKINAAVASLPAAGGTVDARAFQGAAACATTVRIDRPVHLRLGPVQLTLQGNPGMSITSYDPVVLEGNGWEYNYAPGSGKGTVLISGSAAPLIMDNSSQGSQFREVELFGNGVGTFGYFGLANGMVFDSVHAHGFQYTGIFAPGGMVHFRGHTMINANGGDGLVGGGDIDIEGEQQVSHNGGNGVHLFSGSVRYNQPAIDNSGLHGLYFDGRAAPDWTANTNFISPTLIKPVSGNPGGYYFYSYNVNGTTESAAPAWPQSVGATVNDGSAKWINVSTFNNGTAPHIGVANQLLLSGGYIANNGIGGIAGVTSDNVRLEGASNGNHSCAWNTITGLYVTEASTYTATVTGVHLVNCDYTTIGNLVWLGSGWNPSSLPPEQGGLVLENSNFNSVSNYNAVWSTRSAVRLINASGTQLDNIQSGGTGTSTTESPNNYAVQIDANSGPTQINNLTVDIWHGNEKGVYNRGALTSIDNYQVHPSSYGATLDDLQFATLTNAHGRQPNVPVEFDIAGAPALAIDGGGNTTVNGDLNVRDIPGHEYFVSKYANIQAAIDAAYNNGTVLGGATVIDDRLAPYSGPGFIVRDSVTLKLAATTYTIASAVSNNNGVSNVTAGIISMPGSHIVGAGTSANHGTNVNAGAGLNADLIATSTVGTGAGANAQWWHWGSIENFHMDGKKASQTAGNCINVENMGETAVLRALEVGNCYGDDIRLEGNFATQSEISNVTVNGAGQFGVDLDNFQGVGVLRGLSGDSNATSIIRFNGNQSATLTVLGLKSEEEISGHDPLITIDMPADGSQPAFYLVGGYTYARPGVHDVIKIVNGKSGSAPFVQVSNFYVDANFVNAVNDTVNSRTFAASNMNKVPFSYLPTGSYQSGQAFTFAPGTFIQGGTSALTEIFGSSTDGSSMIAAQGNGDGTSYFTGGLKIGIPNRTQFGQPPEMMARMGSRFLGVGNGYDTNTWVFVPIWKSGDSSNRWIGDPNQRWPKVYASDVNATTATIGTLNVTSCTGCGGAGTWGSISGTLSNQTDLQSALNGKQNALGYTPPHSVAIVGPTSAVTGTGAMTALYSVTIPAGTFTVGTGVRCVARSRHTTGSGSVSMGWKLGGTTYTYPTAYTTGTTGGDASIEIFTFSSLAAETVNIPWASFGGTTESPYTGLAWSENLASVTTLQFLFNVASSDKLTGDGLYCMTVQ